MQLKPIKTEKAMHAAASGRYTFAVDSSVSKPVIKRWVEKLFVVGVEAVHTQVVPGRSYRSGQRGQRRTRPDWKKATVTVKSGQKIDLFEAS